MRAWIGLGANLGNAQATLTAALAELARLPDSTLGAVSSIWRSAPIDSSGPDYLNAVAEISTALSPLELLDALQAIELGAGRERPYRNAPRTLDLDIVRFADLTMTTERLTLPHPRWNERAFVLQPMAELLGAQVLESLPAALQQQVKDQRIERLVGPEEWLAY